MNAMDEVSRRFSDAGAARRWNDMYCSDTVSLEEHSYRSRRDRAISLLLSALPPQARVLDLGCGTGPTLCELRRRGIDCTGADASADMLRYAGQRLSDNGLDPSGLILTDIRNTPFPDAHFDAVLCMGVISYVEDYETALREIRRILKPGGRLIISWRNSFNPVACDPVRMLRTLKKKVMKRLPAAGRAHRQRQAAPFVPGRFLDYRDVTRRIEVQGFRYADFAGIGFGPFRFNGRALFHERHNILISNTLSRAFSTVNAHWFFKHMADISLWVYTLGENL